MARKPNATGRNHNQKFIKLHAGITGSAAYQDLSAMARALLIEVWRRHNGSNNGGIPYGENDGAEALRTGRNQIRRALTQLVDHGFLVKHKSGSFNTKIKHTSEWEITAEDLHDGTKATHAYRSWQKNPRGPERTTSGSGAIHEMPLSGSGAIHVGVRSDTREGQNDPPLGVRSGPPSISTIGGDVSQTTIDPPKSRENAIRPDVDGSRMQSRASAAIDFTCPKHERGEWTTDELRLMGPLRAELRRRLRREPAWDECCELIDDLVRYGLLDRVVQIQGSRALKPGHVVDVWQHCRKEDGRGDPIETWRQDGPPDGISTRLIITQKRPTDLLTGAALAYRREAAGATHDEVAAILNVNADDVRALEDTPAKLSTKLGRDLDKMLTSRGAPADLVAPAD